MNYLRALKVLGSAILVAVVGLFIIQAFPGLVGADLTYTVQSSSMEPAIPTGSVVFVKEIPAGQVDERIQEGDVITFADSRNAPTTTHRVVEKHEAENSVRIVTKGDANEDPDPEPVYRDEVIGVVTMSIPLLGYVVAFSKSTWGWFLMIVVPVVLLLMDGLWQFYLAFESEGNGE